MKARTQALAVATVAVLAFASAGPVPAGETGHQTDRPREGSTLSMSQFYTGSMEQTGSFPGKLICLRCDVSPSDHASAACKEDGHRHALSMKGGMVHPLLPGTEEIAERINSNELHGKEVRVSGKHYPSIGFIFVSSIEQKEG